MVHQLWRLIRAKKGCFVYFLFVSIQKSRISVGSTSEILSKSTKNEHRTCWAQSCCFFFVRGQFPVFFFNQIFQHLCEVNRKMATYTRCCAKFNVTPDLTVRGREERRETWMRLDENAVCTSASWSVWNSNYLYLICLSGIDIGHTFGTWCPHGKSGYFYSHWIALFISWAI